MSNLTVGVDWGNGTEAVKGLQEWSLRFTGEYISLTMKVDVCDSLLPFLEYNAFPIIHVPLTATSELVGQFEIESVNMLGKVAQIQATAGRLQPGCNIRTKAVQNDLEAIKAILAEGEVLTDDPAYDLLFQLEEIGKHG